MRTLKAYLKLAVVVLTALKIFPASGEPVKFPEFKAANINGAAGAFSISNANFHLSNSAGSNGTFFVFQKFSGNGQISARIRREADSPAKVGIIFQQRTNAVTQSAGVFLADTNTVFERVFDIKQTLITTAIRTNEIFEWLRVVREGNAFSGFHSNDGTNWIQFSADSIEMPINIFAGLAIDSAGEATFDNVRMTSARLVSPPQNSQFVVPTNIFLKTEVTCFGEASASVEFFSDAAKIGDATNGAMIWTNVLAANHSVTSKITTESGSEFFTEPANFEIKLPPTVVTFLRTDEITKGNWKGKYGAEGFLIANDSTNLPSYAELILARPRKNTWEKSSGHPGALVQAGSNKRIASTWYSPTNILIDLTLADGNFHCLTLYFLDWDKRERTEEVHVIDVSGKILNSQKVTAFLNGKYLSWRIRGHVVVQIKRIAGGNTVVSGVFLDPEKPSVSTGKKE